MNKKLIILLVLLSNLAMAWAQVAEPVLLPNGWKLTPAGKQLPLGDLPLNMAVSPNGRWLAVTNNGYGRQCIKVFDTKAQCEVDDKTIAKSWYGLCFSHDGGKLFASAGNDNQVKVYDVSGKGKLSLSDSIVMGKPWEGQRISPSGIAMCPGRNQLFVVTRWDNSLYVYDWPSKHLVCKAPIGGEAYQIVFSPKGDEAYVSVWGSDELAVWDVGQMRWKRRIPLGSHPNEMCLDAKHNRLFVANANDNSVSVVDLTDCNVEETLNAALFAGSLQGSTTNGLCLMRGGKQLAIANADNNCLTLFDVSRPGRSRSVGFIPVGWYPTNVKCIGNKLWVTNGKGLRSMANPNGPVPIDRKEKFDHHKGDANHAKVEYIGGLFLGALSIIDVPKEKQLSVYSHQVFDNTPYNKENELVARSEPGNPIPARVGDKSPIKHVFYVIKENRTYDQVLGDMPQGNGDSTLTLFGARYTPNLHKIAGDFVLLDNFYVNAEVSCDGHNWTMGGYATDYLEKTWPTYYSNRGDEYSGEGKHKMGNNKGGFLWDMCQRFGVSYRTYGEFCDGTTMPPEKGKRPNPVHATIKSLEGHCCESYEPFNLSFRDTLRYRQWEADFDTLVVHGNVPQFCTVRLGNDHTKGMKLKCPTPYAYMADNDLAVGMFLDHLSHSPIWKESVVFIIEDDAQNGSDHVDAHRSTAYLAGGFVKRGYVDHTPYTTTSMLRTMELILGLPPMSQYDASAASMWRCFTSEPDATPYDCQPENVSLDDVNQEKSKWQAMSETYDFSVEDNVPDVEFNKVLWHGIKGDLAVYPPLRRSAFLIYKASDDDDDN